MLYTHTKGFRLTFSEKQFCKRVLSLYFDDIVKEVEGAVLFNEEMAEKIIAFIEEHKKAETLLVHCYGGQSRSRAVGAFAVKMLGGDNSRYLKTGVPHMRVDDTSIQSYSDNRPKETMVSSRGFILHIMQLLRGVCVDGLNS